MTGRKPDLWVPPLRTKCEPCDGTGLIDIPARDVIEHGEPVHYYRTIEACCECEGRGFTIEPREPSS